MRSFIIAIITFLTLNSSLLISNSDAQWVQMSNGMGTDKWVSSLIINGNNIFAGVSNGEHGVYLSTNNGNTWTLVGLSNQSVTSLAVSGNNIFAGTDFNGVYLSTNDGANWTQTTLYDQTRCPSLAVNGNYVFAGTSNGIYISSNNGSNWTKTDLESQTVYCLLISGNIIFAGAYDGAYISTNNGANWSQAGLSNISVLSFAISGNNVFAGTFGYGAYLSTNNGISWTQTTLNTHNVYGFSLAVSGNNIFAGTGISVYLSTNNGVNWFDKNQGFNNYTEGNALLIVNNYIFVGTSYKSVWRRSLSEIIGMQNISTEIPAKYSLGQNYPNPFNPSTRIKFDVERMSDVKVVVYDVMGREVQTLVNERLSAGTYETTFDARHGGSSRELTSGVYFYKLKVGDYSETKIMTLIK